MGSTIDEEKPKSRLPPGMVLGPDGKPCKACSSSLAFRNWRPPTIPKSGTETKSSSVQATATAAGTLASVAATAGVSKSECPPGIEQIGRATWTFLHTTAAYYPEHPTPTQRANMISLIRAIPILYPCWHCADDFGDDLKSNPPDVSGRAGLSRWLCERHNTVNLKLGKAKFDCDKTDERWKDGPKDGSCD